MSRERAEPSCDVHAGDAGGGRGGGDAAHVRAGSFVAVRSARAGAIPDSGDRGGEAERRAGFAGGGAGGAADAGGGADGGAEVGAGSVLPHGGAGAGGTAGEAGGAAGPGGRVPAGGAGREDERRGGAHRPLGGVHG